MPTYEIKGQTFEFEKEPTDADIDEIASSVEKEDTFTFANLPDTAPVSPEKKSGLSKLLNSPFTTGVGTFGELARREESLGAVALAELTASDPSVGRFVKGATQSITGEKILEFGDVLKRNGADPITASIGGLVMSAFLPSNFMLAGAGKELKMSTKVASSMKNAFTRTPNTTRNPLIGTAANFLAKDPRRVKQLIDNADVYTPLNADPRNARIIAGKIQGGLEYLKREAPDVLAPSEKIPFQIANKAIGTFDETFKQVRKNHRRLLNETVAENPNFGIKSKSLVREFQNAVVSSEKDLLRKSSVPGAKINEARSFFARFLKKLSGKGTPEKVVDTGLVDKTGKQITRKIAGEVKEKKFNLQDLIDIRTDLGELVEGTFQIAGQPPVVNEVIEIMTKRLRRRISSIIQNNFDEIAASDAKFVVLGEVDSALKLRGVRKAGQMGNFLNSKSLNPFKAESIQILDDIMPAQSKIAPRLTQFAEARANSLEAQLKMIPIDVNSKSSIEGAVLRFDAITNKGSELELLRKLDSKLPGGPDRIIRGIRRQGGYKFMEDLTQFDLARAFSKAGSIFKASASGNLAAGALPEARGVGLIAGVGATIPPAFARLTQGAQAARSGLIRGGQTAPGRLASSAVLKKLLAGASQQ